MKVGNIGPWHWLLKWNRGAPVPEAALVPRSTVQKSISHPLIRKAVATALLTLVGLFAGYHYFLYLQKHRPRDFVPFYLGGKMAASGHIAQIYDKRAYAPFIEQVLREGAPPTRFGNYYFIHPSFEVLYYLPFSFLSYPTASDLSVVVNFLWLGLLVWKLPVWFEVRTDVRPIIRIGLLCFYPFHWAINLGQDTLPLTLLLAYALRLAARGRPGTAGLLMAFCCCKPHLIWAYPLVFVVQRRWRAAGTFLIGATALALLSFLPVGWSGFQRWIDLVQDPSSDILPDRMGNIRALALHFGTSAGVIAGVVVIACLGLVLWKGTCYRRFTGASLAPILVSPHTYWQDYSVIAIPIAMTPNLGGQLLLLAPWQFFYTRVDELPMVFVAIGWLVIVAVAALQQKRQPSADFR